MIVDWSKMTPWEIYESLKTAPKVAGPWENGQRRLLSFPMFAATTDPSAPTSDTEACQLELLHRNGGAPPFSNREQADRIVRAAGWLLVDDVGGEGSGK